MCGIHLMLITITTFQLLDKVTKHKSSNNLLNQHVLIRISTHWDFALLFLFNQVNFSEYFQIKTKPLGNLGISRWGNYFHNFDAGIKIHGSS
jgi:hypothetical protein